MEVTDVEVTDVEGIEDTDEPQILAAGCLVYRRVGGDLEVLVAHRPHYDDWDFPKGKLEPGETELDCALRETEEETGYTGVVGDELPSDRYVTDGKSKRVRWWLLAQTGGHFTPNDEVDLVAWLTVPEAAERLTYSHAKQLLEFLPSP